MALNIKINAVTPFRQNCSLLWDSDSKEAVLVDAGGDSQYLLNTVQEHGLTLTAVWLTHGHLDHAAGVPALKRQHPDLPVFGPHRDDAFLLDALPESTAAYGFEHCPPFTPEHWLNEGDSVQVGRYAFRVLHTPGHTPGHIVFHCPEEKLLLAGDVLFYESIGRTDFPRGSHQDLSDNIRNKLYILPDDTRVIPGHGRNTDIGHEKRHNPYVRA